MINKFYIDNYRKFSHIELDNLGRINFLVGNNNVGKTTILEAIYAWACGNSIPPIIQGYLNKLGKLISRPALAEEILFSCHNFKNMPLEISFSAEDQGVIKTFNHKILLSDNYIFYNNTSTANNAISKNENNKNNAIAVWSVTEENSGESYDYAIDIPLSINTGVKYNKKAVYMDILAHRDRISNVNIYSMLKRNNLLPSLLSEMEPLFSDIVDIDVLPYPDGSVSPLSVKVKNNAYIPISKFGDGFQRWFYIIGSFVLYEGYIVCIDEIDAMFHPASHQALCRNLIKYARKYNVQLFLTSHNIEFIDSFLEEANNYDEDDIRIITLKEKDETIKVRNLSGKEAYSYRDRFSMELR